MATTYVISDDDLNLAVEAVELIQEIANSDRPIVHCFQRRACEWMRRYAELHPQGWVYPDTQTATTTTTESEQ